VATPLGRVQAHFGITWACQCRTPLYGSRRVRLAHCDQVVVGVVVDEQLKAEAAVAHRNDGLIVAGSDPGDVLQRRREAGLAEPAPLQVNERRESDRLDQVGLGGVGVDHDDFGHVEQALRLQVGDAGLQQVQQLGGEREAGRGEQAVPIKEVQHLAVALLGHKKCARGGVPGRCGFVGSAGIAGSRGRPGGRFSGSLFVLAFRLVGVIVLGEGRWGVCADDRQQRRVDHVKVGQQQDRSSAVVVGHVR